MLFRALGIRRYSTRRHSTVDEREEFLEHEISGLEEQTRVLAKKIQELVGVDCSLGACIFDPEMTDVEAKIAEVQKRKKSLEKVLSDLEAH